MNKTSGTGDVLVRLCPSCSYPEHGNSACPGFNLPIAGKPDESGFAHWPHRTLRIMDDQLYWVDPGSPPVTAILTK